MHLSRLALVLLFCWAYCLHSSNCIADENRKVRPRQERRTEEHRTEEHRTEERRSEERRREDERLRSERDRELRDRVEQDKLNHDRLEIGQTGSGIPHGFANVAEFISFNRKLNSELIKAGCPEAKVFFQGSAVTGREYLPSSGGWTGRAFDIGRISDFDIALCSESLFAKAKAAGLQISSHSRTEKLGSSYIQRKLGLDQAARVLSSAANRPVEFKIYRTPKDAFARGPSIPIRTD